MGDEPILAIIGNTKKSLHATGDDAEEAKTDSLIQKEMERLWLLPAFPGEVGGSAESSTGKPAQGGLFAAPISEVW